MSLRIHDWDEHQTYRRDRNRPPWIKVHRDLMRKPKWVKLSDAQRGQLVAMWILAADEDGNIPSDAALIRKLCYMDEEPDLEAFVTLGFIDRDVKVTPERRQDDAPEAEAEERREEADTETTGSTSRAADVENSTEGGDDTEDPTQRRERVRADANTGAGVESDAPVPDYAKKPAYTRGELLEIANDVLGMKTLSPTDQGANMRILNEWLYGGNKRDPMEVYCAIMGAADMRDRDLIGWEDSDGRPTAGPGRPVSLKAMVRSHTLFDQGDGSAVRSLYDVAVDHHVKSDEPPTTGKRGGGPRSASDIIALAARGAA